MTLELYNRHNCVHLPVINLKYCPNQYRLHPGLPQDLKLIGLTLSKLQLQWHNIHMHNIFNEEIIKFEPLIKVPHFLRLSLHSILQSDFRVNILIQHNEILQITHNYN